MNTKTVKRASPFRYMLEMGELTLSSRGYPANKETTDTALFATPKAARAFARKHDFKFTAITEVQV